ncbi:hypothetical protein LCGC14_1721310, partial [marine sediment metagenome]
TKGYHHLDDAQKTAEKVVEALSPFVDQIAICGSIRRKVAFVGDIDIIVAGTKPGFEETLIELEADPALVKHTFEIDGVSCDVSTVDADTWGAALMHHTGSKGENIRLRKVAKKLGKSLSQYGLRDNATRLVGLGLTEQDTYAQLGQEYKEPEER